MNKMFLLATTVATAMAGAALPSQAGNLPATEIVSPQYYGGGGTYPYPGYDDSDDDNNDEERISCWEGRREVRRAGFREVRPVRCSGDIYRYSAVRRHHNWTVRVDAYSGQIVSVRPVRYY
jgi:hypothetical protein